MAFEVKTTLNDMLAAMEKVLAGEWPKIRSCMTKALEDEAEALKDIAEARLKGEIDEDEMKSELDDEKLALKAALLACQVQAKVAAEQAANAAIQVLADAIKAAL